MGVKLAARGVEMITLRKSHERGQADHGWLVSQHTFSFADYYDPAQMHFRALRVINEDRIAPQQGFGTHPHQNMEILTYVLEGLLEHQDTLGNQAQIHPGEFQLMSAGKGVQHSEYNPSATAEVHLLQIWIFPNKNGLEPSYQQQSFAQHQRGLKKVVSPDGQEGALKIHQDVVIYLGRFAKGQRLDFPVAPNRSVWIQVTRGNISVNNTVLQTGDGAQLHAESLLALEALEQAEFLLFDLA